MATKNLSKGINEEMPSAGHFSFGIVVSEWNQDITENLLKGALQALKKGGVAKKNIHVVWVPGSFELAHGGTIFLDEIGDMSLDMQVKLLRVLQERLIDPVGATRQVSIDVRVIAATHRAVESAIQAGRFREDLYYRLNVLPVVTPPLRERQQDIPELLRFYAEHYKLGSNKAIEFSAEFLEALVNYPWPGNVRELQNRMRRAVVMADQRLISAADLGLPGPQDDAALALEAVRALAEREAIEKALGRVDQNMTHAARLLGVSRMTLYRLRQKHGLADYPIAA